MLKTVFDKVGIILFLICFAIVVGIFCLTSFFNTLDGISFFEALDDTYNYLVSSYAIYSIILSIAIEIIVPLFFKISFDMGINSKFACITVTIIFLYCCISDIFNYSLNVGSVFIGLILSIVLVLFQIDNHSKDEQVFQSKSKFEKALISFAKRKIKDCHQSITSIQIYSLNDSSNDGIQDIVIKYLDCGKKERVPMNAILEIVYRIPKQYIDSFNSFQDLCNDYISSKEPTKEKRDYIEEKANADIKRLRESLEGHIRTVNDITDEDICIAHLIRVYMSRLANVDKENPNEYIGIVLNDLNLCGKSEEAKEINDIISQKQRTGFLGTYLINKCPYLFFYESQKNSKKSKRAYFTFLLDGKKNSYLILITFAKAENIKHIQTTLLESLRSIKNGFFEIANKYSKKEEGVNIE